METFEPPPFIADLISAINDGAKAAQNAAFAMLGVGLFLIATAFSTTDEDLLFEHTTSITQLGVQVPTVFSFAIAPMVFVALHVFTLVRYDMLAVNLRQFCVDLIAAVPLAADRERCRQLLANVEFVAARVPPRGSQLQSLLFRSVVFGIVAVFPVGVLTVMEVSALRYQNDVVIYAQRGALWIDLFALLYFFYRQRLPPIGYPDYRSTFLRRLWLPAVVLAAFAGLNFAWVRIPDPAAITVRTSPEKAPSTILQSFWRRWQQPLDWLCPSKFDHFGYSPSEDKTANGKMCPSQFGTYIQHPSTFHFGCRFLNIDHRTLVMRAGEEKGVGDVRAGGDALGIEEWVLRGRTLRFANLDQSTLRGADLTDADLRLAILWQADLNSADLLNADLEGADFSSAHLQGTYLQSASLEGAILENADLRGATLSEAHLEGACLNGAHLEGANLHHAHLVGATLSKAHLEGADLTGADLRGVSLDGANLSGAKLAKSQLWHARFGRKTEAGLVDFHAADFTTRVAEIDRQEILRKLRNLPAAKENVRQALTPLEQPAAAVRFTAGPALISQDLPVDADRGSSTTDSKAYHEKLVTYLADELAPSNPAIAMGLALHRALDDEPLASRLLANTQAGMMKISDPSTLTRLKHAVADTAAQSAGQPP